MNIELGRECWKKEMYLMGIEHKRHTRERHTRERHTRDIQETYTKTNSKPFQILFSISFLVSLDLSTNLSWFSFILLSSFLLPLSFYSRIHHHSQPLPFFNSPLSSYAHVSLLIGTSTHNHTHIINTCLVLDGVLLEWKEVSLLLF